MNNQTGKLIGLYRRFIDHDDGTITDTRTSLMWKRLPEQGKWAGGTTETFSFAQAMALQGSTFAGYADWRLPSIEELRSLLDARLRPMLDDFVFVVHSGHFFWSSTRNNEPRSKFDGHAYILALAGNTLGFGDPHTGDEHVRLVRGAMRSGVQPDPLPTAPQKLETQLASNRQEQANIPSGASPKMVYQENLAASQFSLTVSVVGAGAGEVKREPNADRYDAGQVVRLTAVAHHGSKFLEWRGGAFGGYFVCNLRMDSAKTVAAAFDLVDATEIDSAAQKSLVVAIGALQQVETIQNVEPSGMPATLVDANGVALDASKKSQGQRIGHFYDHGDGTVTDTRTGLMWKRAAEGQEWTGITCRGSPQSFSFEDACEIRSGYAGHSDWRLPHGKELTGLQSGLYGRLDDLVFPNQTGARYWLSDRSVRVWWTDKKFTDSTKFSGLELVRLVRDGQRFVLDVKGVELGAGHVERYAEADTYAFGQVVTLTALPGSGFKFKAWHGDAIGSNPVCTVMMDSAKGVYAEFSRLDSYVLDVTVSGTGSGVIVRSNDAATHLEGSVVTLEAQANYGSIFSKWLGDAVGGDAACTVTMDSAKVVSAEFSRLESYVLDVTVSGTGSGVIVRDNDAATHLEGDTVSLTAQASEGSIFNRWLGDAVGVDEVCVVQMNSAKVIAAEFEKVSVPDFGLAIDFESAKDASMKDGDAAIIFYLSIRNQGIKQTRVAMPLASYVNQLGEEIEQSVWLSGMVIGNDGATIRAGAFRKMGLVFYKARLSNIAKGDRLYLKVIQSKPAREIGFTLKCVDTKSRAFVVVNAAAEDQQEPPEAAATSVALTHILQRVVLLEEGMAKLMGLLDALPRDALLAVPDAVGKPVPVQTLQQVLTRLVLLDRISIATFRVQLLPLDLLPNAVVNEVNERALDLTGEMALEEVGDEIVVAAAVFDQVLANWDWERA